MPEGMFGVETSQIAIAVLGVGAGFLCLILVLWLIRGRGGPSPFLRGGKNRQPRLQVLDAAAVDTRRRLVLVRRDDVEHLIMIGGPTDVVIESSIVDGRSPPYHTMMKTISEPERATLSAAEEPRVSEQAMRPAEFAAPAARVAPAIEKTSKPEPTAKAEDKDNFAWIGSEPVEISPVARPAEPARPAAAPQPTPPQPVARKQEPPKPVEAFSAPAQSAPVSPAPPSATPVSSTPAPKVADITPPAETRAADAKPVIEFPTIDPRATVAAPAPDAAVFSNTGAAASVAPAVIAPVAMKAEPAPMVHMDETLSETPADTRREAPGDVYLKVEPGFDIAPPRVENHAPSLDNAADLLDAARERVFQQPRTEMPAPAASAAHSATMATITPAQRRPAPASVTASAHMQMAPASSQQPTSASAPPKPLGSDFERILEEEMASNLAGGSAAPTIAAAHFNTGSSPLPRRDPALPRVTGASQEPGMQNEIARIFGEMSVTKDDR